MTLKEVQDAETVCYQHGVSTRRLTAQQVLQKARELKAVEELRKKLTIADIEQDNIGSMFLFICLH